MYQVLRAPYLFRDAETSIRVRLWAQVGEGVLFGKSIPVEVNMGSEFLENTSSPLVGKLASPSSPLLFCFFAVFAGVFGHRGGPLSVTYRVRILVHPSATALDCLALHIYIE